MREAFRKSMTPEQLKKFKAQHGIDLNEMDEGADSDEEAEEEL